MRPAGGSWLSVTLLEGKASIQNTWGTRLHPQGRLHATTRGMGLLEGQQPSLRPGALTYSASLFLPVLGEVFAELLLQIHEDMLVVYKERQGLSTACWAVRVCVCVHTSATVCACVHQCECVNTCE